MRLGLHDIILDATFDPAARPASRPAATDADRAPWVRALHARLAGSAPDGNAVTLACTVRGVRLAVRVRRNGGAVSAVWESGEGHAPVAAASVLLRGADPADDAAALESLRRHQPRLPIEPADYAAVSAMPRPCLATFYVDARSYEDGRVDLLAGALALAELFGPSGTLKVRQPPAPAPQASAAMVDTGNATGGSGGGPDSGAWPSEAAKLDLARERLGLVMELVSKKSSAAIQQRPGTHFQVFPPARYLGRPDVLDAPRIFQALGGTSWLVRWYDGREDRLNFTEFLGFVDQVLECERAYSGAVAATADSDAARNAKVWPKPAPTGEGRRVIRAAGGINLRKLVSDERIRELLREVAFERTPSDDGAPGGLSAGGAGGAARPRPRE